MPKSKPTTERMPFSTEIGERRGKGQDNAVYQMVHPADKPHLRKPNGTVLKINHGNAADHRIRYADDRKAAEMGVRYKKNKYDILKAFLGDYIPDSSFVLGEVENGRNDDGSTKFRYAEYTIQQEVPRFSISDLSEEQRKSPILRENVFQLLNSLQRMYRILGEVNARTSQGITLDGKLDLGGVSKYVLSEDLDNGLSHEFGDEDIDAIVNNNSSPNLLVDPESHKLYCIDFDQGQWYPGMDEAKEKAIDMLNRERAAEELGSLVIQQAYEQQRLDI